MVFPFKKKIKINPKMTVIRVLTFLIGLALYAAAFNLFFYPLKIVIGGISGISIITNHFFNINVAEMVLITSLFSLILGFLFINRKITKTYVLSAFLFPMMIFLTSALAEYKFLEETDIFIAVIFGGLIAGIGKGLIFKSGFVLGETDILSQIINKHFKITQHKANIMIDGAIILASGIITSSTYDFAKVMYAIVGIYITTTVFEKVMIGISNNKTFYIFTDKIDLVKEYILTGFKTSLTVMKAKGGFSLDKEDVLMCVISTKDYFKLREGIKLIDENAFFVVTDAYETTTTKIKKEE